MSSDNWWLCALGEAMTLSGVSFDKSNPTMENPHSLPVIDLEMYVRSNSK